MIVVVSSSTPSSDGSSTRRATSRTSTTGSSTSNHCVSEVSVTNLVKLVQDVGVDVPCVLMVFQWCGVGLKH